MQIRSDDQSNMCYLPGTNALSAGMLRAMAYRTPSLSLLVPDRASSCPCTHHPSGRQLALNQLGWGLPQAASLHGFTAHSEDLVLHPSCSTHNTVSDGASLPAVLQNGCTFMEPLATKSGEESSQLQVSPMTSRAPFIYSRWKKVQNCLFWGEGGKWPFQACG